MPKKQPVSKQTPSITEEQLAGLRELMPHVFSEGKVDFDKLHAALGDFGNEAPERYSFSWAGKRDAIRILQTPSRATLAPARKESVDFDKTQNLFIEGDNLEALKLLYKPYFGQVKMIYIDPPYNTGNDFVYPDNFADPLDTYLKLTGQKDSEGNLLTSNAETSGRYHSTWLSMMYPRLFLARQLLTEDGVIFISIDDHEAYNLRMAMNEVFGEENFIAQVIWQKVYSPRMDAQSFSEEHDYVLIYSRSTEFSPSRIQFEQNIKQFTGVDEKSGKKYRPRSLRKEGKNSRRIDRPNLFYPIIAPDGTKVLPIRSDGTEGCWRWSKQKYENALAQDEIEWIKTQNGWQVYVKQLYDELATKPPSTIWLHTEVGHNHEGVEELKNYLGNSVFDNPKPTRLVKRMLQLCTSSNEDGEIILDFFSGSGTTSQAVLELNREDGGNRKFILVQLPEPTENKESPTIAEIGKERIRRVIKKMKKEREGQLKLDKPEDLGFKVFKLRESNYKQWEGAIEKDPKAYAKQMEMLADPLVKGWKEEDVLYEAALKEGYGLNIKLEETKAKGVQKVSDPDKDQAFYICLADKIKLKDVKPLELKKDDLFICRDIALDDETAANLSLQCRLKTI